MHLVRIFLISINNPPIYLCLFRKAHIPTHLYQVLKPLQGIKLDVLFQLLHTDGAQDSDTTHPLLLWAAYAIHQALVIDAVAQTEHVAHLLSNYVTRTHEPVLVSVWVLYAIESRVIPL